MTNQDDERAARIWVEHASITLDPKIKKLGHTLKRLLDRPVLPRGADVPDDVLRAMGEALAIYGDDDVVVEMRAAIDVLHAHLTAPPPAKKVEVWGLAFANGRVMSFGHKEYTRLMAMHYPGSRVVKLVEAADADQ